MEIIQQEKEEYGERVRLKEREVLGLAEDLADVTGKYN